MLVTIKEPEMGIILWKGEYKTVSQAIAAYRDDLGAEAYDYDAVNPNWVDDLTIETEG